MKQLKMKMKNGAAERRGKIRNMFFIEWETFCDSAATE